MTRRQGYWITNDSKIEALLRESEVLGHGNNGIVYLLPDGKVMKVFSRIEVCDDEYSILKRVCKKSKHFPKVYVRKSHYIIRDYVGGQRLDKYLRKKPLNKIIVINLIMLLKEFKKLGFKKLDIRCKDLYVQDDMTLMVIDPKQCYTRTITYPRHLMKGINNRGYLPFFLECVKDYDEDLFKSWKHSFEEYLKQYSKRVEKTN